jgi:hypothetical protein
MTKKALYIFLAGIFYLPVSLFAQNSTDDIDQRFDQFRNKTYTEKVYIHTDKKNYLAGELIWWKLYYVDGYFHKPANLSKIVYVELLDINNQPVLQAKSTLGQEGSNGSFYLPLSINSGHFTLRAYTNWMKNGGPDYFFSKSLTVINSMKDLPSIKAKTVAKYGIQLFPEGGNLVQNIESKIAFQVTDQFGRGQECTGAIINSDNDTLVKFSPLKNGIGNFLFTPSPSQQYKAVVKLTNGEILMKELPAVFENGYVMRLSEEDKGHLKITVTTNLSNTNQLILFAHTRQVVKAVKQGAISNGTVSFLLDRNTLGEGVSHLTVFSENRQPVCERLYFTYPRQNLSIAATSDAGQYGERKKVQVTLQTKTGEAVKPASVSIAVYRAQSEQTITDENISSYFWLSSDLQGKIESPVSYLVDSSEQTRGAIDNLMLTHGWRRFNWQAVLKDSTEIKFVPEFDGHIVTGKIFDMPENRPAGNVTTYLSIPGGKPQFYPAISDSAGFIRFDVHDYYGPGAFVLKTDNTSFTNYRFEINSPFWETPSQAQQSIPFIYSDRNAADLAKSNIAMQVQNVYQLEQINKFSIPAIDTFSFYGKQGSVYMLDDYTRFTTMEEVLREYVLEIGVRKKEGKQRVMVNDLLNRSFFESEPLILLDGMPVSSEKILGFDPMLVKKLQVIPSRYQLGETVYEGVVSFSTYRGDLEELQLNAKAIVLDYDGLQLKREFYSPVYDTEQQAGSRIPDYRNLLYWSPDIHTDKTGKARFSFYTADLPGKYIVEMEGMDADGRVGTCSFTFEVKESIE